MIKKPVHDFFFFIMKHTMLMPPDIMFEKKFQWYNWLTNGYIGFEWKCNKSHCLPFKIKKTKTKTKQKQQQKKK